MTILARSVILPVLALAASLSALSRVEADEFDLQWEITNRFAPFEMLDEPAEVFKRYRIPAGANGLEEWHRQFDGTGVMVSPYSELLETGEELHWNTVEYRHHDNVLRYIRRERAPDTTILVDFWVEGAEEQLCLWSFLSAPVPCINEEGSQLNGVSHSIPLYGTTTVSVEIDSTTYDLAVAPEHIVIVALGDSYGSGEGNPDVPARWLDRPVTEDGVGWLTDRNRLATRLETNGEYNRFWVDDRCHRSFFSHQSLTALKLASDDRHAFVSFLHYACTGAEIFDGILAPQWQPWGDQTFLPLSQLNAALRDLCRTEVTGYEPITSDERGGPGLSHFHRRGWHIPGITATTNLRPGDALEVEMRRQHSATGAPLPSSGFVNCAPDQIRSPDYVFASIGGNDIGFGDLVRYWLLPHEYYFGTVAGLLLPSVCPDPKFRGGRDESTGLIGTIIGMVGGMFGRSNNAIDYCENLDDRRPNDEPTYHAGDLINGDGGIAERYALLFRILEYRLDIDREQIVMPQYPDPLRASDPTTQACDALSDWDAMEFGVNVTAGEYYPHGRWEGLKSVQADEITSDWEFNLATSGDHSEVREILEQMDDFRSVFAQTAESQGITFVCETRDAFLGYGWWLGKHHNLPNRDDPTTINNDERWNVADWQPYAFELPTRSIRTANDSALTQPQMRFVDRPIRTILGTVHPNLTGHRLIAQEVADHLQANPLH